MLLEDIVKEWIDAAETDIKTARFLVTMHPTPLEIIGFHSQQAIEKCLKAFLIQTGEEPLKTHDLLFLLKGCRKKNPEFPDITAISAKLNAYAVDHRYPGKHEIDDGSMIMNLEAAETAYSKIISFISTQL